MSHLYYDSITKIKICNSLYENGVSPEDIPGQLGIHRATVYRWLRGIKRKGINKFVRDYKMAKKGRRQTSKTSSINKCRIYQIRDEYRQCCGQKIKYLLERDFQTKISLSTIYRILNEKYQLRGKWSKNIKRGMLRKATKPREVLQVDTVDFGFVYAFTSIDIFTKEPVVVIKDKLDSLAGKEALIEQLNYYGVVEHIQRDGGSEFKDEWDKEARKREISVRTAKPYKKNEQSYIERFNGILRKECLGYLKYRKKDIPMMQKKVNEFIDYYMNKRPHLSLNMLTPKIFAMSHLT